MNIGIREKTRDEAFVEAIEYWAERAIKYEKLYLSIRSKVDSFVGQFIEQDD